jgi:hypothetical protein
VTCEKILALAGRPMRILATSGNTLNVKGSAIGIRAEGPLPQSLAIRNNNF